MLIDNEISIYLKEVRKEEIMTNAWERELAQKFLSPNTSDAERIEIKDLMVRGNLRLVLRLVKRYQNQGLALADLISEGNIGLIKAINNFDWTKNINFISYASWWVKQSIIQALNEKSRTIRIPTNLVVKEQKEKRMVNSGNPNGNNNSENMISLPSTMRLEDVINKNDNITLLDIIEDEDSVKPDEHLMTNNQVKEKLINLLNILNEKERAIIQDYFGLYGAKKNLEDIGNEFNLTRERVRQIKEIALRKLRNYSYDFFQ